MKLLIRVLKEIDPHTKGLTGLNSDDYETDSEKNFVRHHAKDMYMKYMGSPSDKDTVDFDDSDVEHIPQIYDPKKDKVKRGYEPVNSSNLKETNEDLDKWFKEKWVNIGKKVDGKHPPCGTSGEKKGYAKCVPAAKAAGMSKKEKESATRRKRAAQNDAGRGGKDSKGQGKTPIYVSTKPKNETMNIEEKINLFLEKNCPTDPAKWSASKSAAKSKFDVYPSAYANGWAAKNYKGKGGGWKQCNEGEANALCEDCWDGYKQIGSKMKNGKMVPNCVPINEEVDTDYDELDVEPEEIEDFIQFLKAYKNTLAEANCNCVYEAEYQGREVKLGKPMQGDVKKFKVYVKNPAGNVVKVNFGQKGMKIRKSNPAARKSFRARMNCDNPGPRHKANYWSCRKW
jgi:hypothetical protein